jgi:molybdopterin synthase catalytic subunit
MANPVYEVLLTKERLEAPSEMANPEAGAVLDFWGVVRALEDGRQIEGIEYEAHASMAKHQLEKIAEQAFSNFALEFLVIHHRTGFVAASESSLFVRVATRHRAEAFVASQWIVDELKKHVPIWKRPRFKIAPASLRQREQATAMRK